MIRAFKQYFRDEFWPRRDRIFKSAGIYISLFAGLVGALNAEKMGFAKVEMKDALSTILGYASIAVGFCLAGMTLSLTIPNTNFVELMAKIKAKGQENNPHSIYSDLIFVFSWTAGLHLLAIVACFMWFLFCGSDKEIAPSNLSVVRQVAIGLSITLLCYCLIQFFLTLITLSQVGNKYIENLNKPPTTPPKA